MKRTIELTVNWFINEDELTPEQKLALNDEAENRIYQQRNLGYVSGELNYEDDELSVRGHWEFNGFRIQK